VKPHSDRDRAVINLAGFLRSFGVGLMGVVLGIYLSRLGFSPLTIGIVIGIGLAGAASATATVSFFADHFGRKRSLLLLSLFTAIGGLALAVSPALPALLLMVFIGMLNGTGTERSASYALEQAVLPGLVPDSRRTWSLAFYNVLIDGGGSLGALCAGLPLILHNRIGFPLLTAYKFVFLGYAALYLATAGLCLFLSPAVEVPAATGAPPARIAPETRKVVTHLTALFSLDAFGGGFLTDALVSYWFFHRFGIAERVGDDQAFEAQVMLQEIGNDAPRGGRDLVGIGIERWHAHVRGHDGVDAGRDGLAEGRKVDSVQLGKVLAHGRHGDVGIGGCVAVSRKVLGGGEHAAGACAANVSRH
jgi:MFS family permease